MKYIFQNVYSYRTLSKETLSYWNVMLKNINRKRRKKSKRKVKNKNICLNNSIVPRFDLNHDCEYGVVYT